MLKKIVAAALLLLVVVSAIAFVWARSVFGHDAVRNALAAQLSKELGQPVTIGTIDAAIYPRVAVNLGKVEVGTPAHIQIETLQIGTDLRALLSRRIEHGVVRLYGARIDLPLPTFTMGSSTPAGSTQDRRAPVDLISIDEIVLRDVAVTSGTRTVHGDIELVPHGGAVTIRRASLHADDAAVELSGEISEVSGPTAELTAKADKINFDRLLAFVSDFAARSGFQGSSSSSPAAASAARRPMNIIVSLNADSATMGDLSIQKLSGRARIGSEAMRLEPIRFGVFGGSYEGSLQLTLGRTTDFKLNASVAGVDMAAATAFMGSPDTITGRLATKLDIVGRGLEVESILRTARGTARIDITNGIVKRLGLIRTIVVTTSGRADAPRPSNTSSDEPFTRVSATLAIANGTARTQDIRLESKDLLLQATGTMRLDGNAIDLAGQAQLSDELSKQAGRDLVRYTQQDGRVTLPVTITGTATNPHVQIDLVSATRRAIIEGLKGIFRK